MDIPKLTQEQARAALEEVTAIFEKEESVAQLEAVKSEAGGDLMKWMQMVVPMVMEMQKPVLLKYGFADNQAAAMQFALALNTAAGEDEEMKARVAALRSQFMPPGIQVPGGKK
ncbi:uncharacterized protein AMSG_11993 [Thecamonas trahens ATCC 50062]|uniref:Protein C10 n=1 Tax=Thecamonas trahens ATCC 50062 TaxID=461836 RepID=A0A0L0DFZ2_THETB|nr:hypothetical protein AMSG_11993 [Thecamonas trahens ATCC 50062]KNC51229.1 hypothetical protein AMSG_11993 [Thecamonas trahens ATCC 50062]|eukprot:XP_013756444.1 hypothetical protein AMSG_11993 [Thecamonas trahens ATCC 50062]